MTVEEKPNRDRITQVRFSGLRTAADIVLDCEPMTVLIGPNGVGKSTLIEGLELLRKLSLGPEFLRALNDDHGGAAWLLRRNTSELKLGADISDGQSVLSYDIVLARRNGSFVTQSESLRIEGDPVYVRDGDTIVGSSEAGSALPSGTIYTKWPLLSMLLAASPTAARAVNALAGIEVHVPFATQARWFGPGAAPERTMRGDAIVQSTDRLDRGGANLANAVHELRNRHDWADTLETIRLVIDEDIIDVTTPASASGGSIGLSVTYRTSGSIPAFALSDGTLALLGLIAIARLDGGESTRSLLVMDEPELHLHPGAIGQIVALLEECSAKHPVVIATHSDRLLDSLSDPASATVLCDLDERRSLQLRRPDKPQLERWLAEYRGIGQLRAEGYDKLVFPTPKTANNG
ncbi:MAG: ATP-binding protein [Myxococcales bacterium]|nr:ATP-binding protein [Myxococcales bacterium]